MCVNPNMNPHVVYGAQSFRSMHSGAAFRSGAGVRYGSEFELVQMYASVFTSYVSQGIFTYFTCSSMRVQAHHATCLSTSALHPKTPFNVWRHAFSLHVPRSQFPSSAPLQTHVTIKTCLTTCRIVFPCFRVHARPCSLHQISFIPCCRLYFFTRLALSYLCWSLLPMKGPSQLCTVLSRA